MACLRITIDLTLLLPKHDNNNKREEMAMVPFSSITFKHVQWNAFKCVCLRGPFLQAATQTDARTHSDVQLACVHVVKKGLVTLNSLHIMVLYKSNDARNWSVPQQVISGHFWWEFSERITLFVLKQHWITARLIRLSHLPGYIG